MDLGASHGIRFRFESGLLSAVVLDVHRKADAMIEERLFAADVAVEPMHTAGGAVTRWAQDLGVGTRELTFTETRDDLLSGILHQRFQLGAPVEWDLRFAGPVEPVERGAKITVADQTSLTVETDAPYAIDADGMRITLPAGGSDVTMTVRSTPVFGVGDTVVVCRPGQVREAAIVVSCLPADRLTPIVVVEPPPMREADYIELFREYEQAGADTQKVIGGALGKAELMSGDPAGRRRWMAQSDLHIALGRRIAPYRSWLKRNEMVSALMKRLGIERVVFLDEFAAEELSTLDPKWRDDLNEQWTLLTGEADDDPGGRMLTDIPVTAHLTTEDLTELTTAAWRLLRDPDGTPERVIDVPLDDSTGYVAALFTALRTGAALRAVRGPGTPIEDLLAACNPQSEEAVLVENTCDPDALVGAVYAHHRGARLVITPAPDLAPVQHAVAEQQRRITAGARSAGGGPGEGSRGAGVGAGFTKAVRRHLPIGERNPYAALEAAVTAQVPRAAITEVGERRLTAFTTGLPYPFVRTGQADWSRKPIGHVAADPTLIILNEIYSLGIERSPGAFSLVFDPGFFRTSETADVIRSISTHFTHPILLPGPDEVMLAATMRLPRELPVELIFFNTHGSEDEIVLGEVYSLGRHAIPQWLTLSHRPIVFNNSCQSWTGVGREFVRVGARGYIGSLWSIRSAPAADFGRIVTHRLTAEETPACEAIVGTGLPTGIERSYLYVGTANGRLDQWHDRATTASEAALAECTLLADVIQSGNDNLVPVLRRELTTLKEVVEGTPQEQTLAYADVLLSELRSITGLDQPTASDLEAVRDLAAGFDDLLARLDVPAQEADQRRTTRFLATGSFYDRLGLPDPALADLQRALATSEEGRQRAGIQLLLAEIQMRQGKTEQALSLARSAHDAYERAADVQGLLKATGTLGQLSIRQGRRQDAMRYIDEGYARASALREWSQQCAFKLDQCTLHQIEGDYDAAINAASTALDLARTNRSDWIELSAVGKLASCHRDRGDLDTAERYASTGLAQAVKLEIPTEIGAFNLSLATVLTHQERHPQALKHYCEAAETLIRTGSWELGTAALLDLAECATLLEDADALWSAAAWSFQVCTQVDQHLWASLLPTAVETLKKAIETAPFLTTELRIGDITQIFHSRGRDDQPDHVRLLGDIVVLILNWLTNKDRPAVTAFAQHLDRQVNGDLGMERFVSLPYSQRARNHGITPQLLRERGIRSDDPEDKE